MSDINSERFRADIEGFHKELGRGRYIKSLGEADIEDFHKELGRDSEAYQLSKAHGAKVK